MEPLPASCWATYFFQKCPSSLWQRYAFLSSSPRSPPFPAGVRCWALALLLTPFHLLCTCFLVSVVTCLEFSLGGSCKETASCRIMLRRSKRGRDATSPEILGSCCGIAGNPQYPYQLLLSCHSSCLLLFFDSLHYYLPRWASMTRWAAPSWPHQAAGGVDVSGRRTRALKTPWEAVTGQPSFLCGHFCIHAAYSIHHISCIAAAASPPPIPCSRQDHLSSLWHPSFCVPFSFDGSTKSKFLDGQKNWCRQLMQHTCKYLS